MRSANGFARIKRRSTTQHHGRAKHGIERHIYTGSTTLRLCEGRLPPTPWCNHGCAAAALVPATVSWLQQQAPSIKVMLKEDIEVKLWSQSGRDELGQRVTRLDARRLGAGPSGFLLFEDYHRLVCRPEHPWARRRWAA